MCACVCYPMCVMCCDRLAGMWQWLSDKRTLDELMRLKRDCNQIRAACNLTESGWQARSEDRQGADGERRDKSYLCLCFSSSSVEAAELYFESQLSRDVRKTQCMSCFLISKCDKVIRTWWQMVIFKHSDARSWTERWKKRDVRGWRKGAKKSGDSEVRERSVNGVKVKHSVCVVRCEM